MGDLRKRAWQWSKQVTAPFGELTCALFYERSLAEPVRPPANPLGASRRLSTATVDGKPPLQEQPLHFD